VNRPIRKLESKNHELRYTHILKGGFPRRETRRATSQIRWLGTLHAPWVHYCSSMVAVLLGQARVYLKIVGPMCPCQSKWAAHLDSVPIGVWLGEPTVVHYYFMLYAFWYTLIHFFWFFKQQKFKKFNLINMEWGNYYKVLEFLELNNENHA